MRVAIITVAIITVVGSRAATADCARDAEELRSMLDSESHRARVWNTGWAIFFGAAAVGQLGLAAAKYKPFGTFDQAFKEQMYVGAAKATLGAAVRIVLPLRVERPAPNATVAQGGDPCADAAQLRRAVVHTGRRERRSVWLTLIGGTAVNLAGSALLWYRNDFTTALTSFLTGAIVGPISAFTQPRWSWRRARVEQLGIVAGPRSLAIVGRF